MDRTIICSYLQRLGDMRKITIKEIDNFEYRVAEYLAPEEYEYLTDWWPLTGREILPKGKTIFLRSSFTVPDDTLLTDTLCDYLLIRIAHLEGYIKVNGEVYCGLDKNRDRIPIDPKWRGKKIDIEIEAFVRAFVMMQEKEASYFEYANISRYDKRIESFYYDLKLLYETLTADDEIIAKYPHTVPVAQGAINNAKPGFIKHRLMQVVDESLRYLDLSKDGDEFIASVSEAQRVLHKYLDAIDDGDEDGLVSLIGHTHIDVAWLWQIKDTVRKCGHTFANMLRLMEEYPEFTFSCSQPQLYAYAKRYYPNLYKQVKPRIENGQWEFVGPMWVESDCNVISGESLIRQILHGRQFMLDEFGVESNICWLPDTFGFQSNMPQILKKSGVDCFFSYKLHWQAANRFPYGSFVWKGIDGSEILASVPELYNGYNGEVKPSQIKYAMDQNLQKDGSYDKGYIDDVIFTYGWGDGGGGPTRDMVEYAKRLENYPMLPKTRLVKAKAFYDDLKKKRDALPVWYGEMALETHRGTYTTHGSEKRYNRKLEILLQSIEKLSVMAHFDGQAVDTQRLKEAWETVLLLQFHDILPGSSIHAVYDDAQSMYKQTLDEIEAVLMDISTKLTAEKEGTWTVFNPLSFEKTEIICIATNEPVMVIDEAGNTVCSAYRDGHVYFLADKVPAFGMKQYALAKETASKVEAGAKIERCSGSLTVETQKLKVAVNADGSIASCYDKIAGREVIEGVGNRFDMYLDGPQGEDAWNLYEEYRGRQIDPGWENGVSVAENTKLRTVLHVTKKTKEAVIEQDIIISDFLDRIEFKTRVDWQVQHKLLKVHFALNMNAPYASCDTGLGTFTRPTAANTLYDQQRFEVVAHKWVDISEGDYGAALLNDCKYGHSIEGNKVEISLLRSTSCPDETADRGSHEINYALYPHEGSCATGNVQKEGHDFNTPLLTLKGGAYLDSQIVVDNNAIIIDTIKPSWDGSGYIVRAYEANGTSGNAVISLPKAFDVSRADLVEREMEATESKDKLMFSFGPYEIVTFKIKA